MQVNGEVILKGTRAEVWALLNDETVLARCIPGCEKLIRVGPDEFQVGLKVGLAAIKGSYDGKMIIAEKREPEAVTLKIDSTGGGGFAQINGKMEMHEQGADTKLIYDWDVQVGGPVAMVGQRVLGGVAKMLIGDFFAKAQKELNARKAG